MSPRNLGVLVMLKAGLAGSREEAERKLDDPKTLDAWWTEGMDPLLATMERSR